MKCTITPITVMNNIAWSVPFGVTNCEYAGIVVVSVVFGYCFYLSTLISTPKRRGFFRTISPIAAAKLIWGPVLVSGLPSTSPTQQSSGLVVGLTTIFIFMVVSGVCSLELIAPVMGCKRCLFTRILQPI